MTCYIVFMANTSEHITVRLPKEIAERIREKAKRQQRSVAWIIKEACRKEAGLLPDTPCPACGESMAKHGNGGFECPREMRAEQERALDDKPLGHEVMSALMDDVKTHIVTAKHLKTCKCLMCRPPKT